MFLTETSGKSLEISEVYSQQWLFLVSKVSLLVTSGWDVLLAALLNKSE